MIHHLVGLPQLTKMVTNRVASLQRCQIAHFQASSDTIIMFSRNQTLRLRCTARQNSFDHRIANFNTTTTLVKEPVERKIEIISWTNYEIDLKSVTVEGIVNSCTKNDCVSVLSQQRLILINPLFGPQDARNHVCYQTVFKDFVLDTPFKRCCASSSELWSPFML